MKNAHQKLAEAIRKCNMATDGCDGEVTEYVLVSIQEDGHKKRCSRIQYGCKDIHAIGYLKVFADYISSRINDSVDYYRNM